MQLIIAEKPSMGRAIAAILPGPHRRERGLIRCAGPVVSWCIGHLLEPAEPGRYDPRWQRWRLADLPLIPSQWRLEPKPETQNQLAVLQALIAEASEIVHAGDPDREGQLLVDEVLRYFRVQCPVKRLLVNDLNPEAIARAWDRLEDNRRFLRLSHSALARQRADWLYGINLTRACTLQHRQGGERELYSVGRVQTPVLGLVVQRDLEIEHFQSRPFYLPLATLASGDQEAATFEARWVPDADRYGPALDSENRLLDQAIGQAICDATRGQAGQVIEARFRQRQEAAPLPLSLSALQIDAARHFRMSAQQVLDLAQSLYEKHRLITYPRSDCRYLPEAHHEQAQGVTQAIAATSPDLAESLATLDLTRRNRAWDDAKVDAHHAIIPTLRRAREGQLSEGERKIYDLVARYYLMQFAADATHQEGRLVCKVGEESFRASETSLVTPGWRDLELRMQAPGHSPDKPPLPRLEKGDAIVCRQTRLQERQTQPPQPFTDATLLAAMTGIARFVSDAELRKTLRETDGLGTEATRAGIIETLFKRSYLIKEKRYIRSTEKGRLLIQALPPSMVVPDMTALWESHLETIRQGEGDPRAFLGGLQTEIGELLHQIIGRGTEPAPHCPRCRAPMHAREGRFGPFWACSRYPECQGSRDIDAPAQTSDGAGKPPIPCPHCLAPLIRKQGRHGWFWGCSNFPSCRQTLDDRDGEPALPR